MNKYHISIIVPTYNSSANLRILFESLLQSVNKNFEVIINDEKRTNDETPALINEFQNKGINITYIRENLSMAQGRKKGTEYAKGEFFFHVDSDMKLAPELLGECITLVHAGFDALVIPEESYGTTFWAKCKWLEKKCYEGVLEIESLRFLSRRAYENVGGHNPYLVQSEDKDLDIRVRKAGFNVGRTKNIIWHNEGSLTLIKAGSKKRFYAKTGYLYAKEHPLEYRWQRNIFNRYIIFLKNIKYLFQFPLIYIGLFIIKTYEFGSAAIGILQDRILIYIKNISYWQKRCMSILRTIYNEFSNVSLYTFLTSVLNTAGVKFNSPIYCLKNGVIIPYDPETMDLMVIRECLINNLYSKYIQKKKLRTVVDFGAHKGFFILGLLNAGITVEHLVAVEPFSENIKAIKSNLEMNHKLTKGLTHIYIEEGAVSGKSGEMKLHITQSGVHHSLRDPSTLNKIVEERTVSVKTPKEIFDKYDVHNIDVLKIDIEGSEFDIFSTEQLPFLLENTDNIIIEIHPEYGDANTILDILINHNFKLSFPNEAFKDLVFASRE